MVHFSLESHCPDCFYPSNKRSVCDNCHFDRVSYADNNKHLPLFSVLAPGLCTGRVIGEGGFGIVYSGYLEALGNVAIKEFFPERVQLAHRRRNSQSVCAATRKEQDFEFWLKRFYQECSLLWQFRDIPTIVNPAREPLKANGTVYLIMERLRGCHLEDFLIPRGGVFQRQLSVSDAMGLFHAILDTLSILHDHNPSVYHRDITLMNIFLVDGLLSRVKLLDFGLARSGETVMQMVPGTRAGTPEFASPEQLQGGTIGPYTDIYSTGAVIYSTLFGKLPPQTIERLNHDRHLDYSQRSDIPKPLLMCLKACLHLDPNLRPQSVKEVYRLLEDQIIDVEPHTSLTLVPDDIQAQTQPVNTAIVHADVELENNNKPVSANNNYQVSHSRSNSEQTLIEDVKKPEYTITIKVRPRRAKIDLGILGPYKRKMKVSAGVYQLTVTHPNLEPYQERLDVTRGNCYRKIVLKPPKYVDESLFERFINWVKFWIKFLLISGFIFILIWIKSTFFPS